MKKTLLFSIIALALNVTSFAQAPTYVENFDSTLREGIYPRMYINTAPGATIAISKPSSSELALTLNNVSGTQYGIGFLLGKRNSVGGWDPIDLRGKNLTIKLSVKSALAIPSLKVELTDTSNPGHFIAQFFAIPGGNVPTTLEYTFTTVDTTGKGIDISVIDNLLINFNAVGPAVNTTVTFDMISVGSDIATSTLAAEIKENSKVYPNPCSDKVNFESALTSNADVKVSLCDMVGKVIESYTNANSNLVAGSFDVSNLEKGLYTLTYNVNGAVTNSQIVMVK